MRCSIAFVRPLPLLFEADKLRGPPQLASQGWIANGLVQQGQLILGDPS